MPDLSHQWGSDLSLSATGDLALASGPELTRQRVIKRLLTNQGDYIWQLDYGAGLASFVGLPVNAPRIQAVIRSQIFKEAAVARSPEPTIDISNDVNGIVAAEIRYVDATTGDTQLLTFSTGA